MVDVEVEGVDEDMIGDANSISLDISFLVSSPSLDSYKSCLFFPKGEAENRGTVSPSGSESNEEMLAILMRFPILGIVGRLGLLAQTGGCIEFVWLDCFDRLVFLGILTFVGVIDDVDAEDNAEVLMPKADPKVGVALVLAHEVLVLLIEASVDEVDANDMAFDPFPPIEDCILAPFIHTRGVCASRIGDEGISMEGNGVPSETILLLPERSICIETLLLSI